MREKLSFISKLIIFNSLLFTTMLNIAWATSSDFNSSLESTSTSRLAQSNNDNFTYFDTKVDIRDVAQNSKSSMETLAAEVLNAMVQYSDKFFDSKLNILKSGVGFDKETRKNAVYGIEFEKEPFQLNPSFWVVPLIAFYQNNDGEYSFRRFELEVDADTFNIYEIRVKEDIPLISTAFEVRVGLSQLKVVMEDPIHNIKKVYPLGVGGLDEGVARSGGSRFLTPYFVNGYLSKKISWLTIAERWSPSYFAGRPFIRVSNSKGDPTGIGFHYKITSQLKRGFVSHRCMRMRDKDLYEMFAILVNGSSTEVPVNVLKAVDDNEDHPYAKIEGYNRVKNFGTENNPETQRGKDGLLIMEWSPRSPLYIVADIP